VIRTFRAHNYGCLTDVNVALTPLHAFIGPNDSGKSTLLHGLRTVVQFAGAAFQRDGDGWAPFDPYLPTRYPFHGLHTKPHDITLGCGVDGGWYAVETGPTGLEEKISLDGQGDASGSGPYRKEQRQWGAPSAFLISELASEQQVVRQLQRARFVRLDPDALRRPSGLIPETAPVGFLDDRGHGLAGVYFAIRNRNDSAFSEIVAEVREYFPTIKGVRVKVVTPSEVVLEAELVSGVRVDAGRLSEGLLYYLAFAALKHLDPVSLLLVEEPENGLHPARIGEVMRILRGITVDQRTQVVMATHSPLVINELQPDEVSVVTRTEEAGTKVTPIKDTANFAKRSSVYALGELWLSFADGVVEAPLIHGRAAS
jgi:predicted ATPase